MAHPGAAPWEVVHRECYPDEKWTAVATAYRPTQAGANLDPPCGGTRAAGALYRGQPAPQEAGERHEDGGKCASAGTGARGPDSPFLLAPSRRISFK